MPVYHTGTSFFMNLKPVLGTYQYILYPFMFFSCPDGISLFFFYEVTYTGTYKFPFRALIRPNTLQYFVGLHIWNSAN
jgi:hypothetical protein